MGIRYDRYFFDGPVPISTWSPPVSGLRKFNYHPKYPCWLEKADSEELLLVAFHLIPQSTPAQRRAIHKQLIAHYRPPCNAA